MAAQYRYLAFVKCRAIPKILFSRSDYACRRWNIHGEYDTGPRLGGETPRSVVAEAQRDGAIRAEGPENALWYIVNNEWKEGVLDDVGYEVVKSQYFKILEVVLQAFPEAWSEILWEEIEGELWPLIESTCVPFLGVLEIDDIKNHLDSDLVDIAPLYLSLLLRFLIRLSVILGTRTPHNFPILISEGLTWLRSLQYGTESEQEVQYIEILGAISNILNSRESLPHHMVLELQSLSCHGSKRSNAAIGLALGHLNLSSLSRAVGSSGQAWSPLSLEGPSAMEVLAQVSISGRVSLVQFTTLNLEAQSLDTKVLIAFLEAKNKNFENAYQILSGTIEQIETNYGEHAMESIIIGTAMINCANATDREEAGERHGQHLLSGLSGNNKAGSQQICLMMSMADSFLGLSKLDAAQNILAKILRNPSNSSAIIVATELRMLKISRRLKRDHSNVEDWHRLAYAVNEFHSISDNLKYACLEEVICRIAILSQRQMAKVPQILEIVEALSDYRIDAFSGSQASKQNVKEYLAFLHQATSLSAFKKNPETETETDGAMADNLETDKSPADNLRSSNWGEDGKEMKDEKIAIGEKRKRAQEEGKPRTLCTVKGCITTFSRKADIYRHIAEVHGDAKKCPVKGCPWKNAKREGRLKAHMMSAHPKMYKRKEAFDTLQVLDITFLTALAVELEVPPGPWAFQQATSQVYRNEENGYVQYPPSSSHGSSQYQYASQTLPAGVSAAEDTVLYEGASSAEAQNGYINGQEDNEPSW
ncbi:uncharacterized protein PAC_13053 [Phialocephala subalpina]|uniref:C2H2-type domain-containing protein n=1 Tax=Phialocephala subalpina TaxID=576137 RepID=A0A1L7XDT7_9HELO|nr:uncharacterized protein PAC_13053 [Phialocephala subalpina]